jgi:two-component system cell cycle response regulator DivK
MPRPTVLIIEDNEQNLYLMRFLLERGGFLVTDARTGREGITQACAVGPDIILLDIQLPEMDGYAVATGLREQPLLSATPIIAVTSYAMVGDRERALAAGATDYLEKPIDPETFVAQVAKHLRRPGEGGQAGCSDREAQASSPPVEPRPDTKSGKGQ